MERHPAVTRKSPPTPFRQMELSEILRLANAKVAALPSVAAFEYAPARDHADRDLFHFRAQIRAMPTAPADAIEFRYTLPVSSLGRGSFEERAWHLLGSAHLFQADDSHRATGRRARSMLEPIVAAAGRGTTLPRIAAVGVAFHFADDEPVLCADLEMLGNDLEVGIERLMAESAEELVRQAARAMDAHRRRDAVRARAQAEHASGWVSHAALRIIDAACVDRRDAIGWTREDGNVGLFFANAEGRTFQADLFEQDGEIKGWVAPTDRSWSLKYDELTVWGEGIPEALGGSLPGRTLGSVFASDLLPADALITSTEEVEWLDDQDDEEDHTPGWLRLHLDIPASPIDRRTGDVPAPEGAIQGDHP